jgi:hypothetical protein
MRTAEWFVGIDWASETHTVCIVDRAGRVVDQREVKHTATALHEFIDALLARADGEPSRVAIGIEAPRGAVVELLVERGFPVYAINPKQLDRFRDRFTVAGAKDDRRDALAIGDSLRTDPQAYRRVRLDDPLVLELREWSRIDEDLGGEQTRLPLRRPSVGCRSVEWTASCAISASVDSRRRRCAPCSKSRACIPHPESWRPLPRISRCWCRGLTWSPANAERPSGN